MSLSLGPLALPASLLLLLLATALASLLSARVWARGSGRAAPSSAAPLPALSTAVLVGLAAARLAHVGAHANAYLAEPWAMLDLRDGGWHTPAGLLAGGAWVLWQAWRHARARRALLLGAAAGLGLWTLGQGWLAAQQPRALPDVVVTDLSTGQSLPLRQLAAGQPVLLNLWASWCGPCRAEMPALVAAQARHPQVRFVLANQGEPAPQVRAWLAGLGLPQQGMVLDSTAQLGPALGAKGLPTTVVFDARGQRVASHMGVLNGPALAAMLKPVLTP